MKLSHLLADLCVVPSFFRCRGLPMAGLAVALLAGSPSAVLADTDNLPPGYSIRLISSNLSGGDVSNISQLAFKAGDLTHLYAVRASDAKVSRYDYDPVTGDLSNETPVAQYAGGPTVVGLGFHGTNLYTASDHGTGDERISRWFDANNDGTYEARHDIVHNIPTGNHNANQIQINGDSLYLGIGAAGRKGDDAEENFYTMTIARIVDLNQVVSTNIGGDFKGPINYLASTNGPNEWINTAGTDGQLRYYASGFRNPFGIAFDPDGDLWVSVNGNSDDGFLSDDFVYKKVQLGDEGEFPPSSFGFAKYISGNPITNLVNLGLSPSPGGFDFILEGPDAGKVLVGNLGATRINAVGRDLLLVDPDTGSYQQIYQWDGAPNGSRFEYVLSDVVRDPYGRFVISDYGHARVWLLTTPLPQPVLSVADSGSSVDLTWPLTAVDYELHETSDPMNTNSWTVSTALPQITTDDIQASVVATNTARFFRLVKN